MKLISLRLPEKLERKLEKYAQKLDRPKSYLMRKALEMYLENLSKVPEDILKLAVSPIEKRSSAVKHKNIQKKTGFTSQKGLRKELNG